MLQLVVFFAIGSVVFGSCPGVGSDEKCPEGHCSHKWPKINEICIKHGQQGQQVWVECDGGFCWCGCSCVAGYTHVAVSGGTFQAIQDVRVGGSILALQNDKTWASSPVRYSSGTTGSKLAVEVVFIETASNVTLLTTPDHPFLLSDWSLKPASRLTLQDQLVDANTLAPMTIKRLHFGHYDGPIWNLATSEIDAENEDKWNHLINTEGIVSGDYYAQLHLIPAALLELPEIGSQDYVSRNGDPARVSEKVSLVFPSSVFRPARRFVVPGDSVSFLPREIETARSDTLRSTFHTVPLEIAEYIVYNFRREFTDVIFHIEEYWHDNTVNAYAWREGAKQHVALLGGLIRHKAMDKEGIALVVAHEIGHHYGGAPKYPNNWASCEGQSDYWGALVAMRRVWWGTEALRMTKEGADQLSKLFSSGLLNANYVAESNCGHPPAACRRETYLAATRLDDKPSCAGPSPYLRGITYLPCNNHGLCPKPARLQADVLVDVKRCERSVCLQNLDIIRDVCKKNGWQSHWRVLLSHDDTYCFCLCGEGKHAAQKDEL